MRGFGGYMKRFKDLPRKNLYDLFATRYFDRVIWSKILIEECAKKDPEITKGLSLLLKDIKPELCERLTKSIDVPIELSERHFYQNKSGKYMWLYPIIVLDIFNQEGRAPLKSQLIMPRLGDYTQSFSEQQTITLEDLKDFYSSPKAEKPIHRFLLTLAEHIDVSDLGYTNPIPFEPVELVPYNLKFQQLINRKRHPVLTALDILKSEKVFYVPVVPKDKEKPQTFPKAEVDLEL